MCASRAACPANPMPLRMTEVMPDRDSYAERLLACYSECNPCPECIKAHPEGSTDQGYDTMELQ